MGYLSGGVCNSLSHATQGTGNENITATTMASETKKAPIGCFFLNLVGRAGFEPATN